MTTHAPIAFRSPLLVDEPEALPWVDFGRPAPIPAVDALADRLNGEIMALACDLPTALRAEAEAVLRGYAAPRRFIDLFYRPVWSFLHWLPQADHRLLDDACRVQAMGLFLHLWDDHLSDGQLAPDLLRLHLRSLAWRKFAEGAASLRIAAEVPAEQDEALVAGYLASVHRPGQAVSLAEHAERMVAQVGIWRVAPLLYGRLAAGVAGSAAASCVVERFSVAWRLLDDIQDVASDVCANQQNALALALDGPGRALWAACAAKSAGRGAPDPVLWRAMRASLERGAVPDVLSAIEHALGAARAAAAAAGLHGLADELAACVPADTFGFARTET